MSRNPASSESVALPALAILGSMVSGNLGAAFAKSLFLEVGFPGVTALRVGISALLLLAFWRPWRRPLPRRSVPSLLGYGITLGAMNILIYSAFSRIPIGVAVAIEVTGPLLVVLSTSRRLQDFAWLLLAAAGLSMLLPVGPLKGAAGLDPLGIAFAAGAALCWALYIVFGKRVSSLEGGQALAWGMLVASMLAVPLGLYHAGSRLAQPNVLAAGLAVALLSSILPYTLELAALRRLPMRVFGLLVSATPAVAALAGFLVLHERLTLVQWLAIACVMAASGGSAWAARSRPSEQLSGT